MSCVLGLITFLYDNHVIQVGYMLLKIQHQLTIRLLTGYQTINNGVDKWVGN
jgi:hypothetical protein